jgi:hypothetical protein
MKNRESQGIKIKQSRAGTGFISFANKTNAALRAHRRTPAKTAVSARSAAKSRICQSRIKSAIVLGISAKAQGHFCGKARLFFSIMQDIINKSLCLGFTQRAINVIL